MPRNIIALLLAIALSLAAVPAMAACTGVNIYLYNNSSDKNMYLRVGRSDDPDLMLADFVEPGQVGQVYDCATAWFLNGIQRNYYAYVRYENEESDCRWAELITVNEYILWPVWLDFWVNNIFGELTAEASVNALAYEGTFTVYAE